MIAEENGIKYAKLDDTNEKEAFVMMTQQFYEKEPVNQLMQISLVEIEKMFKPYWHEFVGNGLSLVAIDSTSSKVVGIILSWDGATPDNWGLCRLCNIWCCVVPTMSADNIMVNEFVISITEAKLDNLMMEFGK